MKFNQEQLIQAAVGVLIVLVGTLIVWLLLDRAARRARQHFEHLLEQADESHAPQQMAALQRQLTALRLIVNAGHYVLCAIAVVMVLQQLNVNLGSLVLPASFVGAALGLGSQNLVRDMVAGFFIVFEDQFAVGDVVSINGVLGTVEEVGFRVTRLRDDTSRLHYFPNGTITTVAKYPRGAVPLILFVVLEDRTHHEKAKTLVAEVIAHFQNRFNVFAGAVESLEAEPLEMLEPEPVVASSVPELPAEIEDTEPLPPAPPVPIALRYRLSVFPWNVQLVRDKLPPSLTAVLEKAEIKLATGTAVEIINAYET